MAASRVGKLRLSFQMVLLMLFTNNSIAQVHIDEVAVSSINVPREAVSQLLIQSALNSLNERLPNENNYRNSQLIQAQKLVKSPFVTYKLKLKLEPACVAIDKACPNEICTLDVRQHEQGVINVSSESINCELESTTSDGKIEAIEKEIVESLEKQIIKQHASSTFDREVQLQEDPNYRPFVAVRADQSEYCPGCPYELNPSLRGLSAFSEQALRSMDESGAGDFKHKLVSIVRVSRAVPPNANIVRYQLLMEIAESNCLKSSLIELSECSIQANLPIKLCLVTFEERPWRPESRIITKNNCTEQLNTADNEVSAKLEPIATNSEFRDSLEDFAYSTKPSSEFFDQIAQEAQEVARVPFVQLPNLKAADAGELAYPKPKFSTDKLKEFDEFLRDFDVPNKSETTTVDNAAEAVNEEPTKKHQAANDKNPEFTEEEVTEDRGSTTLEQAAAAFKEKSVTVLEPTVESARIKRENALGARQPHDPDDPQVKKFIELGLQEYSKNFEGTHEPMISKVKKVTVQVVAGLLYRIETDIGASTCRKGETTNCQLRSDEQSKQCVIEAWSQPWIDKGNPKIQVNCDQKTRSRRSLRGVNYTERMLQQSRQLGEERLFRVFMSKYNREYESEEEKERRLNIFRENLNMIEELQRNEQGTASYGITQFADLTKAEFTAKYLGLKPSLRSDNDIPLPKAEIPDIEIPDEFDWRHFNVVTPVKNQGSCGSCWAFSVTGNIEGQYAIKHGQLLSLSEQELVDCDKHDSGCNGGLPDTAYRAIEELGGLETETDYPYDADDEKCHFDKNKVKVSIVSGLNITSNETQMAQWLVKNGPMSIGINANAMQFYMGGVSHPFKFLCSSDVDSLDHGVLIVGYGIKTYPIFKKSMPYWLIKNSWGPHWGEQGYYRVYRGDGTCGVNQMVTSAVVA